MQALTGRLLSFIFLFVFSLPCVFSQNKGNIGLHTAKFMTGDDLSRSQPGFSDTGWKDQRLGEVWQRQGFPDYHGFAWYRIHVIIPSSLKNDAGWKDSLRIYL